MRQEGLVELLKFAKFQATCKKHSIGCLIETVTGDYIYGWNGPSNEKEHKCYRKGSKSGENTHCCPSVHAERDAISKAARYGVKTEGGTLYLDSWFPCSDCAKSIIVAGLTQLVTPDEIYQNKEEHTLVETLQNQPYNFEMSERLFREAGVKITKGSYKI